MRYSDIMNKSNAIKEKTKYELIGGVLRRLTDQAIRLSVIVLFLVVAWRLAWSEFNLDLTKFDFSDLLALLLALFAMSMSVAFYFKSTDSSNLFYDNIYSFTQKTSEILGRIEERFDERLKHIGETNERIESRFDRSANNAEEIKKEVEKNEDEEGVSREKLEDVNRKQEEVIEDLLKRARLEGDEKGDILDKMNKLAAERDEAREKIRKSERSQRIMNSKLRELQRENKRHSVDELEVLLDVCHHPALVEHLKKGYIPLEEMENLSDVIKDFPPLVINVLITRGIINRSLQLLPEGFNDLQELYGC